jgi:hypothetical protein
LELDMAHQIALEPTRPAEPASDRPFGLSDAMILTAGAALSMSMGIHLLPLFADQAGDLVRDAVAHNDEVLAHWPAFWRATHDHLRNTLWYALQVAETVLIGLTLAFLALRLRRPRPPLRTLLRQSGMVAVLAMIFGLFLGTGLLLYAFPGRVDSFTAAPIAIGGSVAVAWTVLVLGRLQEPDPGWVGRLGRLLGSVSIVAALLFAVVARI